MLHELRFYEVVPLIDLAENHNMYYHNLVVDRPKKWRRKKVF